MTKLIKNWVELSKVPANDKYKIDINDYCGYIIPLCDDFDEFHNLNCNCKDDHNFWRDHVYLSTHTFYGKNYEESTKILQEHGFDIEIDNWDKE